MKLSESQLAEFRENGFLLLRDLFSREETAILNQAKETIFAQETDANIIEKKSGEVRTAMGLHLRHEVYAKMVRHPRLVDPAQQILGDDLYVQRPRSTSKQPSMARPGSGIMTLPPIMPMTVCRNRWRSTSMFSWAM